MNNNEKKAYKVPELIVWGSVEELTKEKEAGYADGVKQNNVDVGTAPA